MARGGARPGAGRPRNTEKYASQLAMLNDRIAAGLPARLAALELLAGGGFEQIQEVWEPAGLVQITKEVITKEGTLNIKELAFPDLPPDQLVCIRRTRSFAAPDRAANIYLIDRIAGKPTATVEADVDPDGTIEATAAAMQQAAHELAAWRQQMSAQLPNISSAPPTPPTSATLI